MKKLLVITLLALATLFILTACGGDEPASTTTAGEQTDSANADVNADSAKDDVVDAISNWPSFLPATTMAGEVSESTDERFTITFYGASKDEVKAYAEQLKEAGFTVNGFTTDDDTMFSYFAAHENGWEIGIHHNINGAGVYGSRAMG